MHENGLYIVVWIKCCNQMSSVKLNLNQCCLGMLFWSFFKDIWFFQFIYPLSKGVYQHSNIFIRLGCDEKLRDETLSWWNIIINCQKQNTTRLSIVNGDGKGKHRFLWLFFLCLFACRLWTLWVLFLNSVCCVMVLFLAAFSMVWLFFR